MTREPAPGGLAVVEEFLNTIHLEHEDDDLRDAPATEKWLCDHGLCPPGQIDEEDVAALVEVREAIRSLAHSNHHGEPPDPHALETLNRAATAARLHARFGPTGAWLDPTPRGAHGAIGRLLAYVHESMAAGTWDRFKACRRHSCQWAYYDRSRNRSGTWCDMKVCGNREKAKNYRERRKTS